MKLTISYSAENFLDHSEFLGGSAPLEFLCCSKRFHFMVILKTLVLVSCFRITSSWNRNVRPQNY